jgi:hypothetical protein
MIYLLEGTHSVVKPQPPFGELQCEFLNTLSILLRNDSDAIRFPDVTTFAFWCRKGNIQRLREQVLDGRRRLGIGNVFHIAPSNVPVNFAFSYVFGLLSGNVNYVRVPSKNFQQIEVIIRILKECLALNEFNSLQEYSYFLNYDHQEEVTREISAKCQGRLIWGGTETIHEIRKFPIHLRGIEIAFSDRYSFCCMGAKTISELTENEMMRLAQNFYNDTYLMDQNACSSPHLIIWLGNYDEVKIAQERFWEKIEDLIQEKYYITEKSAYDKHVLFCNDAINLVESTELYSKNSLLYRINLSNIPKKIEELRGSCGYFYEYKTIDLNDIAHIVNSTFQTLTYAGINRSLLQDFVIGNRLNGIDRIVPCGQALDIGLIWDGLNIIQSLSRIVDVK